MLGKGESEFPKLERLFNDKISWKIIEHCFDKVYIALPRELEKECTTQYIYDHMTHSTSKALRVNTIAITGGEHIGKNRRESLENLKTKLNSSYPDNQHYVMMLDPDDQLISYSSWVEVFHQLKQTSRPPELVEFNYVTSDLSKVTYNKFDGIFERVIDRDPWDLRIYDELDGYKYYNPKVRVSGIQKLFDLSKIKTELFDKWERYEDGIVFSELLSRIDKVRIVPIASIIYNKTDSEVFTNDSVHDSVLLKLQSYLKNLKLTDVENCIVPYVALYNQISRWIDIKS